MTKKTNKLLDNGFFKSLKGTVLPEATIIGNKIKNIDIPEVSITGKKINKQEFVPVRSLQELLNEYGSFSNDPAVRIEIRQAQQGKNLMPRSFIEEYAYGSSGAANLGEVEDGEVLEVPNGQSVKVKGAKHEQGGVKINIPEGTEIYSDRLEISGHTLAERKEARDKRLDKITKAFEKDQTNIIIKKSLQRTKEGNDFEDEKDLVFQEQAKQMIQGAINNSIQKFAYGDDGQRSRLDFAQYYSSMFGGTPEVIDPMITTGFSPLALDNNLIKTNPVLPTSKQTRQANRFDNQQNSEIEGADTDIMGFTGGDIMGIVGTGVSSLAQMANTIANAKSTKQVVNHYEGFNEKALQANRESTDQLAYNKSNAKTEMERNLNVSENTSRARLRNSASSINSLRSLDLATDVATNEAKISSNNQLESTYGQQLMQLLSQKTGLLSQKDQMEMAGQTAADEANAANLDNFYSNFSQNIAGVTQNIQSLGKNINDAKHRNDVLKVMKDTNPWGIGYDKDLNMISDSTKKYNPTVNTIKELPVDNPLWDWNNTNSPFMQPLKKSKY